MIPCRLKNLCLSSEEQLHNRMALHNFTNQILSYECSMKFHCNFLKHRSSTVIFAQDTVSAKSQQCFRNTHTSSLLILRLRCIFEGSNRNHVLQLQRLHVLHNVQTWVVYIFHSFKSNHKDQIRIYNLYLGKIVRMTTSILSD